MNTVVLESVLTCPHCGFATQETMPTDACVCFYECHHCKALLRPKPGDCCVFCSFGSVKCPPIQEQRGCCGKAAVLFVYGSIPPVTFAPSIDSVSKS